MSGRIRSHLKSNVVGYIALFVSLSGVAWAAGQIGAHDIKANAVRSKHIKDGKVLHQDIAASAVDSGTVNDNSLTGDDLDESTLGQVPSALAAAQGGIGRYGFTGSCNPDSATYIDCSSTTVPLSAPGRILITAQVTGSVTGSYGSGACRLEVTGSPLATSVTTFNVYVDPEGAAVTDSSNATLVAVSDVLPAGSPSVGVECLESGGSINFLLGRIAAVGLSNG